jgi:hypothetical protein
LSDDDLRYLADVSVARPDIVISHRCHGGCARAALFGSKTARSGHCAARATQIVVHAGAIGKKLKI